MLIALWIFSYADKELYTLVLQQKHKSPCGCLTALALFGAALKGKLATQAHPSYLNRLILGRLNLDRLKEECKFEFTNSEYNAASNLAIGHDRLYGLQAKIVARVERTLPAFLANCCEAI